MHEILPVKKYEREKQIVLRRLKQVYEDLRHRIDAVYGDDQADRWLDLELLTRDEVLTLQRSIQESDIEMIEASIGLLNVTKAEPYELETYLSGLRAKIQNLETNN